VISDQIDVRDAAEVTDWIRQRLNNGSADEFLSFASFSSARRWLNVDERLLAWAEQEGLAFCRLPRPYLRTYDQFVVDRLGHLPDVPWPSALRGAGQTLPGHLDVWRMNGLAHFAGVAIASCYEMVRRCIEQWGIKVAERKTFRYLHGVPIREAGGSAGDNLIEINPNLDPPQKLRVLLHELGHIVLAHDGMDEFEDHHTQREIEADTLAYLVMKVLGHHLPDTADYILAKVNKNRGVRTETVRELFDHLDTATERALAILRVPPWQGPREPGSEPLRPYVHIPQGEYVEAVDD
jgi:hypothetical protein